MSRPCKKRRITGNPNAYFFKPAGIPKNKLKEIELTLEEFEAIRLIDYKKIPQEEASKKMHISQPTFSRILTKGRNKMAEGIVEGKTIKINKSL